MSKNEPKTVRVGKEIVPVSDEVYACLRKTRRKIRYFVKDLKEEKIIIEESTVTFIAPREESYDWLDMENDGFAAEQRSVEEILIAAEMREMLYAVLGTLDEAERRLIDEIYFSDDGEGKTEREAAETLGIPNMTLHNRKVSVLGKLKKVFEN